MAFGFAISAPPRSTELGFRIRCGPLEEEAREASMKDWLVAGRLAMGAAPLGNAGRIESLRTSCPILGFAEASFSICVR
jgi:hypothetical protein